MNYNRKLKEENAYLKWRIEYLEDQVNKLDGQYNNQSELMTKVFKDFSEKINVINNKLSKTEVLD